MKLSKFGEKFSGQSGIVELMDDLGTALNENPEMIFMGGGNPGRIPEVEQIFKARLETVLADPAQLHTLLGVYQSPQGDKDFREQIAGLLKQQFGWDLSERNIAVSNGSQSAFFVLYNMFAGEMADGSQRSIHLPLAPGVARFPTQAVRHIRSATPPALSGPARYRLRTLQLSHLGIPIWPRG